MFTNIITPLHSLGANGCVNGRWRYLRLAGWHFVRSVHACVVYVDIFGHDRHPTVVYVFSFLRIYWPAVGIQRCIAAPPEPCFLVSRQQLHHPRLPLPWPPAMTSWTFSAVLAEPRNQCSTHQWYVVIPRACALYYVDAVVYC